MIPRLNKAAGSALKLASKSTAATLFTWLLLGVLTYMIGLEKGIFKPLPLAFRFESDPVVDSPSKPENGR
jgi:hypothetical protein